MTPSTFMIVAILSMLPLASALMTTITTVAPAIQPAYADEDEDENNGSEENEDENNGSETNSEREEEQECNISGVFNTCIIGEAPGGTGNVQTTQAQNETPMILALPT